MAFARASALVCVAHAKDGSDGGDVLVKFDGGIGSQPFAAGHGGVPVTNDVKVVPQAAGLGQLVR